MNQPKTERFELLLRPNIAAEAALLAELEALKGIYGGKTKLLRECLRRGLVALSAGVDACPEQATEDEILNALASEFRSGEYSYRIGKLFLDARAELKAAATRIPASAPTPAAVAAVSQHVDERPPAAVQPPAPVQEAASQPPARRDWSRFRGVAGSSSDEESK